MASHHRRPESSGTPKHLLRIELHFEVSNQFLATVCLLPVCPPQFITEIYEYMSLLHSSTKHTEVTRG